MLATVQEQFPYLDQAFVALAIGAAGPLTMVPKYTRTSTSTDETRKSRSNVREGEEEEGAQVRFRK